MSIELLEKAQPPVKPAPAPVVVPAALTTPAPAAVPPSKPQRQQPEEEDEPEPGFLSRNRNLIISAAVVIGGAIYAFSGPSTPSAPSAPRKAAVPINVSIAPPPLPPPPPPPKVEPPKVEEKMEEETAPVEEAPPEPAPDNAPPPLGSNNVSNGPADGFGLGKATAGSGNGTGRKVGGAGSKFGYYAGQVQSTVGAAVRRNSKTKSATLSVIAKIWADETGRVIRATLSGSSGDPAVDAALKNEVLTGLQLTTPPPAGMKMPINLRLTARPSR